MSDDAPLTPATEIVASTPAAPPSNGIDGTPGSAPAPVDTTAPANAEPEGGEQPHRPSRSETRAIASQRRQINELHEKIGRLQGMIESVNRAPASEGEPGSGSGQPSEVEQLRAELARKETEITGRNFWSGASKEAKEKGIDGFSDARDAIQSGEVPTSPLMSAFITEEAENKAAMVVWLADNPEESERYSKMNAVQVGAALARLDAKVGKSASKRTTGAPPPVPTVGGRSSPTFDAEKSSMDEYAAHWKARQAARGN